MAHKLQGRGSSSPPSLPRQRWETSVIERWMWWLLPPWGAFTRHRQMLALLHAWREQERNDAYRRITGLARILDEPPKVPPYLLDLRVER